MSVQTGGYEDDGDRLASAELTLRDYFAAKAMQALIGSLQGMEFASLEQLDTIADASYGMANAMLKARQS